MGPPRASTPDPGLSASNFLSSTVRGEWWFSPQGSTSGLVAGKSEIQDGAQQDCHPQLPLPTTLTQLSWSFLSIPCCVVHTRLPGRGVRCSGTRLTPHTHFTAWKSQPDCCTLSAAGVPATAPSLVCQGAVLSPVTAEGLVYQCPSITHLKRCCNQEEGNSSSSCHAQAVSPLRFLGWLPPQGATQGRCGSPRGKLGS